VDKLVKVRRLDGTDEWLFEHLVEAGPDLVGTEWMPLFSGALTGGSVVVTDPEWADHSARFYRVRSPE
jgi:hypothetical protein